MTLVSAQPPYTYVFAIQWNAITHPIRLLYSHPFSQSEFPPVTRDLLHWSVSFAFPPSLVFKCLFMCAARVLTEGRIESTLQMCALNWPLFASNLISLWTPPPYRHPCLIRLASHQLCETAHVQSMFFCAC